METKELNRKLIEWRKSIKSPVPTEPHPKYDAEIEALAIKAARSKSKTVAKIKRDRQKRNSLGGRWLQAV